jgi:uncharacterized protein involved in type VI secretion and phage assembly
MLVDQEPPGSASQKLFGKYRATVTQTRDPLNMGRIQADLPQGFPVNSTNWALPCTPYAGKQIGFFTVPPVGSSVWIEFEQGDIQKPIWSGCYWEADQLPSEAAVDQPDKVQVFKTEGMTIQLSNLDSGKGLFIEVKEPTVKETLKMTFNAAGIELNHHDQIKAKLTSNTIELTNGASSSVTITADSIQIKEGAIEIKLTTTNLELQASPAQISLSPSSGIQMGSGAASSKLSPAAIEFSNGAASIKLSPASVNINNGALEVM